MFFVQPLISVWLFLHSLSAPECSGALKEYGDLRGYYECQATLYGTVTMEGSYSAGLAPAELENGAVYPREDHAADDCMLLLGKLKSLFGIERLMIAGGGHTDWSFLQAGCVDELSLVIAPLADGSTTSVSIFERADFLPEKAPAALFLKEVRQTEDGSVWLRYIKEREKACDE